MVNQNCDWLADKGKTVDCQFLLLLELRRGKLFFGYSDRELMEKSGYDLVHTDDLAYFAAAHQECESIIVVHWTVLTSVFCRTTLVTLVTGRYLSKFVYRSFFIFWFVSSLIFSELESTHVTKSEAFHYFVYWFTRHFAFSNDLVLWPFYLKISASFRPTRTAYWVSAYRLPDISRN